MEQIASSPQWHDAIPQGLLFSPDGLCVLTSVKNELQLYNTHTTNEDWKPALVCKGGDVVQSYDWYPMMNSHQPATCCFLGTARDQPVHLYDAYTGQIRGTYSPYHPDRDEPDSPLVTKFHPSGATILCGGFQSDRYLTLFDASRPGRDALCTWRLGKTKRSRDGQKGLVSALACCKDAPHILAVGTYSPGSIYLDDTRVADDAVATVLHGGVAVVGHGKKLKNQKKLLSSNDDDDENFFSKAKAQWFQKRAQSGVTQLEFADNLLLSASRRSDAVLAWDVRVMTCGEAYPIAGVASYPANLDTNQRLQFHVSDDRSKVHWRSRQDSQGI